MAGKKATEQNAASSSTDDLRQDGLDRLADAKRQKALIEQDIREANFFAAPRRLRSPNSNSSSNAPTKDESELQTAIGFEVAEDFMTMLIESFMPQSGRWAERLADPSVREVDQPKINDLARKEDEKIFQHIRQSNFYAELAKGGVPDAAIGIVAMDIRAKKTTGPFNCLAVPIRELEINLGPDGRIDDRFQVRKTKYRHIRSLLGKDITLPKAVEDKIKDQKQRGEPCEIRWGYWRLWDREDDEYWQHVVYVDEHLVHHEQFKGIGSCPLAIGRFGATPDFAWPDGPTLKSLSELRMADEMRAGRVEHVDFSLRPPVTYDDDGVISFEDGIDPGLAYPRRPGNGQETVHEIYQPRSIDAALFESKEAERLIRRLHYVDFPEQEGKTPPTATQWLDQMVDAQKKIGTPGYNFWREFPFEAFLRFKYLGEKRGTVKPIEYNNAELSLTAYNPAQRAAENQEVLTATRLIQIAGSAFPQVFPVVVDPMETITNLKTKLGDKLVAIRDPKATADAVSQLAQLTGVKGPIAPGGLQGGVQGA